MTDKPTPTEALRLAAEGGDDWQKLVCCWVAKGLLVEGKVIA